MKATQLFTQLLTGSLLTITACAQAPPPPPPPAPVPNAGVSVSDNSQVRSIVYAPRGEVQALVLRDETVITLSPELGLQIGSVVSRGTSLRVTGWQQFISGQKQIAAQNIQIGGQSFVDSAPAPLPGPGPRRNRPGAQPPPPAPAGANTTPPPPPPVGAPRQE